MELLIMSSTKMFVFVALFLLLPTRIYCSGDYLDAALPLWTKDIGQVTKGNGAFMSPTGNMLVIICKDASVTGVNPISGDVVWTYSPNGTSAFQSYSGAFFSEFNNQSYVLYSIVENAIFPEHATSTLVALNPDNGAKLFETSAMKGVTKGTPVASKDGSIILTTYNKNNMEGSFALFNFGDPIANVTFKAPSVGNASSPFGAIGYVYNPTEGSYVEGAGNTNDLFMWGQDTPAGEKASGMGQLYAFQLPIANPFAQTKRKVTLVGNATTFQTPNPPVFGNSGYLMYIAATKSEIRYWLATGRPRDYFDHGATLYIGFDRGEPRLLAPRAPPTLSKDPVKPFLFGPTAANQLFRMSHDLSNSSTKMILTAAPLTNKVMLSPDDLFVYYATSGGLHQLDSSSLATRWNISIGSAGTAIYGEIAQSPDGALVYVPDALGNLHAFQVKADSAIATKVPVASSTNKPDLSIAPTSVPFKGPPGLTAAPSFPKPAATPAISEAKINALSTFWSVLVLAASLV